MSLNSPLVHVQQAHVVQAPQIGGLALQSTPAHGSPPPLPLAPPLLLPPLPLPPVPDVAAKQPFWQTYAVPPMKVWAPG